ncbi:MAG UNVERIFIED_CONTAM: hypothetical protein LVR18_06425 [Planctomycetaceae bacterium]|jgi:mono/diheme cytochrome c family protein
MNYVVPDGSDGTINQLDLLNSSVISQSQSANQQPSESSFSLPKMKPATLAVRAASWLHANCASCHVEAGGGNAQFSAEITELPKNVG